MQDFITSSLMCLKKNSNSVSEISIIRIEKGHLVYNKVIGKYGNVFTATISPYGRYLSLIGNGKEFKGAKVRDVNLKKTIGSFYSNFADRLVSWSRDGKYGLYATNSVRGTKGTFYYVVHLPSSTRLDIPGYIDIFCFYAYWCGSTNSLLICFCENFKNIHTMEDAFNSVVKYAIWDIRSNAFKHISKKDFYRFLSQPVTSLVEYIEKKRNRVHFFWLDRQISVSPDGKSSFFHGDTFNENIPEWAEPNKKEILFYRDNHLNKKVIDYISLASPHWRVCWSANKQMVHYLEGDYWIWISLTTGKQYFIEREKISPHIYHIVD